MARCLIFLLFPLFANGQVIRTYIPKYPDPAPVKYNLKRAILPAALGFGAGAAWGLHEKIQHHWPVFSQRFPHANPRYWNPYISWTNKYRNWPSDPRRTGVPVFFTDAKHMLGSTHQILCFASGITIAIGDRRPWWHYGLDAMITFGAYTAGNYVTFDLLYK